MVNSTSLCTDKNDTNASCIHQSDTRRNKSQSSSPITATSATQVKDCFESLKTIAVEPTPTKTDTEEAPPGFDERKFFCSVPLEKVQTILSKYTEKDKVKVPRKVLCLYCDRTFVSGNLRQKHVERCHSSKHLRRVSLRKQQNLFTSTPCVYCDKFTSTEHTLDDLFEHLIGNHSNKYFACLPCGERFLNGSLLSDHNAAYHNLTTPTVRATYSAPKVTEKIQKDLAVKARRKRKRNEKILVMTTRRYTKRGAFVEEAKTVKGLRNKKLAVKNSRLIVKRSKRLEAKLHEQKLRRDSEKSEKQETKETKTSVINPYPEFDSFFQIKKITDHSIDNLKISSLTFDDVVFDKAFFNRIKCNIQENLLHYIDGKLFKNEESENRISNFEKVPPLPPETQNVHSENFGCELSLNAVAPTTLLLSTQFGEDPESQIEYGAKPSKKRTQTQKKDEVHYKYFTRRKYQASILEHKENRDMSKLDMWTQYVIKNRQQKVLCNGKSQKEMSDYFSGEEYKDLMKREELNRILDRRGPFEDLREEATKQAALNQPIREKDDSLAEVGALVNDILDKVFELTKGTAPPSVSYPTPEIPSYLNLRAVSEASTEGEIDRSDRITLICSSQETENFEHPDNTVRDKHEKVELTGEWARSRIYICAACGLKLQNIKQFLEHKSASHQYIWVQHYEFVGNQSELYTHLSIPILGKVGVLENGQCCKVWRRSEARSCTKCGKQCNSLAELHRHVLECGGDWTWMLVRRKCKYKPFGAKSRKKRRGLVKRIYAQKAVSTEKKIYKKAFDVPRQKPSDADTIKRMLANLPAKRATRQIMSLKDGFNRPRKTQKTTKSKFKCGKRIVPTVKAQEDVKTNRTKEKSNGFRRSLRTLNKVLTSRILETSSTLIVKKKYRRKLSEQKKVSIKEKPKRTSPRIEKRLQVDKMNIKRFFPVKKRAEKVQNKVRKKTPTDPTSAEEPATNNAETRKRKSPEATPSVSKKQKIKNSFKRAIRKLKELKSVGEEKIGEVVVAPIEPTEPEPPPSSPSPPEEVVVDKIEEVTVIVKSEPAPCLVENNMKKKRRPTRGLNDCIAMLTSKLGQTLNENVFNNTFNCVNNEVDKSEFILKVPLSNEHFELQPINLTKTEMDIVRVEESTVSKESIIEVNVTVEEKLDKHESDAEDEIPLSCLMKGVVEEEMREVTDAADVVDTTVVEVVKASEVAEENNEDLKECAGGETTVENLILGERSKEEPSVETEPMILEPDVPPANKRKVKKKTNCSSKENKTKENKKILRSTKSKAPEATLDDALSELTDNAQIVECSDKELKVVEQLDVIIPETSESIDMDKEDDDEDESKKEVRRSQRNLKRVTSYNEMDLVDPVFDDHFEGDKSIARLLKEATRNIFRVKRKHKKCHKEKKPDGDELFDLLKETPAENLDFSKPNSFFNNLDEISEDFNDDNFDILDDILQKSMAVLEENMADRTSSLASVEETSKADDEKQRKVSKSVKSKKQKKEPLNGETVINLDEQSNKEEMIQEVSKIYCDICNKYFSRLESLTKHKRTLTHISKLSELEAKEAALKIQESECQNEAVSQMSTDSKKSLNLLNMLDDLRSEDYKKFPSPFTVNVNDENLKLADIINDVLNKPIKKHEEEHNFSDILVEGENQRRCKNLAERKSFDPDIEPKVDYFEPEISNEAAGIILEKQITLLENMIENRSTMSCIDEVSVSSTQSQNENLSAEIYHSANSPKLGETEKKTDPDENFLKPTQYEEVSEDSNLRNDEQKSRKALNRDEELFLECCSLLKSSSELSGYSKKSNNLCRYLNNFAMKTCEEPDWLENNYLARKNDFNDYYSDNSRMDTPLGDSFSREQSNSDTISSRWNVSNSQEAEQKREEVEEKSFTFREVFEREKNEEEDCEEEVEMEEVVTEECNTKSPEPVANGCFRNLPTLATPSEKVLEELSDVSTLDGKKMLTKGAMKVFEGLKVSIPTEELNISKILSSSSTFKSLSSSDSDKNPIETTESSSRSHPKPKKKQTKILRSRKQHSLLQNKIHDVYDFEETQDNSDIFTRPDFRSFRTNYKKTDKTKGSDDESDAFSSSTSSVSEVVPKKSREEQNITKKKYMIMGRIFKNAVKSRTVDEDIRNIPEIDNTKLVEDFVLSCTDPPPKNPEPKTRMTEEELNQAFDQLLTNKPTEMTQSDSKNAKKRTKCKTKKRNYCSDPSDDEFKLQQPQKKRSTKKNSKEEDNCINLEQELRECIGVASRKSQRKCTSGKQNVLIEYWTSDESSFETVDAEAVPDPRVLQESPKPSLVPPKKVKLSPSTHNSNRRKRSTAHPLYHWSSSSEDETDLIEVRPARDELEDEDDRPIQHGWIVGDSPKKLVTMLAQAKGKKSETDSVKESGKKRTNAYS